MSETYPTLKAFIEGVLFLDSAGGNYQNTFRISHSIKGDGEEQFGEYTDKGDPHGYVRTFRLDDDPNVYRSYPDFAAAYYAKYPERIEINRQKEAANVPNH